MIVMRHLVFFLLPFSALTAQTPEPPKPKISIQVEADYLALHVKGSVNPVNAKIEHRLTLHHETTPEAWTISPTRVEADGSFTFDQPLPQWRWAKLEVRASQDGQVLSTTKTEPKPRALTLLTAERIAALPETTRSSWQRYLDKSERLAEQERNLLAAECRQLQQPKSSPAPSASGEFEMDSSLPPEWYASAEAATLATNVLSYQTPSGAWSKSVNFSQGTRPPGTQWTNNTSNPWHYCGTLDNRATTEQIRFLANVHLATQSPEAKVGVQRGIEWLLTAQYPNGGWPQVYPIERGYHEAITLNDGAMLHALEILHATSTGEPPFTFIDPTLRQRAETAFDQGLKCLIACQIKRDGQATVWCAQHDPLTLEPVAARLKEPPSLSGSESAEILKFLMRKGPTTPEIVTMIEQGLAWFTANQLTGLRKTKTTEGKTDYLADPNSTEIHWARFYDVTTGQPMFAGAQDGIIYDSFQEMARHNKVAYDYFTAKPQDLITKEIDRWKKNIAKKNETN
jgi:PelA/Pel-15E family pectate lyase